MHSYRLIKNYFIKENYIANIKNFTYDKNRIDQGEYWTPYKLMMSTFYQADVYIHLRNKIDFTHSILDIGCGPGTKLKKYILPITKHITGIDQKSAIDKCKENFKEIGQWIEHDLESTKIDLEKNFDFIICSDVVEHLEDPDKLIKLIKKFLNKDTIVIFSTPDRDRLRGKDCTKSEKLEHVREWNKVEFSNYIKYHNFRVLEHFHQRPMSLSIKNIFPYFKTFLKMSLKYDRSFKYNQVLVCAKNNYIK